MMMTNRTPNNWKDLEELVAYYFNNSGYEAITPYKIKTVRGDVEVDVYVKAYNELGQDIICECKFWNKPVPQEKIHAFRTVVNDSGSNLGIIISKMGFQKGSYNSADNSNIKLLTWENFLELLFEKWFKFREKKLLELVAPLAVYTDALDVPVEKLNRKQRNQYMDSVKKHTQIYMISMGTNMHINTGFIKKYNDLYNENIQSYEAYFDSIEERAREAILFYEKLFSNFEIPDYKFDIPIEFIRIAYLKQDLFT